MEEKREYERLMPGTYKCSLKIKDCEVADIAQKNDGTWYRTGTSKPGFRLIFKVNNRNAYINKEVRKTSSEKGNLYKTARELHNSLLKDIKFNERGWAVDESALYKKLIELEGKWFDVEITAKGNYTKFVSASPCEPPANADETIKTYEVKEKILEERASQDLQASSELPFEDDDIPF